MQPCGETIYYYSQNFKFWMKFHFILVQLSFEVQVFIIIIRSRKINSHDAHSHTTAFKFQSSKSSFIHPNTYLIYLSLIPDFYSKCNPINYSPASSSSHSNLTNLQNQQTILSRINNQKHSIIKQAIKQTFKSNSHKKIKSLQTTP